MLDFERRVGRFVVCGILEEVRWVIRLEIDSLVWLYDSGGASERGSVDFCEVIIFEVEVWCR